MDSLTSLQRTTEKVEHARKRLNKKYWMLYRPGWCKRDDGLYQVFEDQHLLMREGTVVWGAIVMANEILNQDFADDHPGAPAYVIYSRLVSDHSLEVLRTLSSRLNAMRQASEGLDEEQEQFAAMLNKGTQRAMDWTVPARMTFGETVYATSVYVARKHLERRQIALEYVPLLIHQKTSSTMIVPSKFWDAEFLEQWRAESVEQDPLERVSIDAYSTWQKISIGMGSVCSILGLLGLLLMSFMVPLAYEDLRFALKDKPEVISLSDLPGLDDSSYVEIELNLSYTDSQHYTDGKDAWGTLLVPSVDSNGLVVSFPGRKAPDLDTRTETVVGRARKRSANESQDVGPFRLDVAALFAQRGHPLNKDLTLIVNAEHPGSKAFGIIALTIIGLIYLHVLRRMKRAVLFLRDDGAFAMHLAKK